MFKRPSPVLALLFASLFVLGCGGDGGGGPAAPTAANLLKVGGDAQSGLPGATLPVPLEVRVTDASGGGVANQAVTFSASGGSLSPTSTTTDTQGRARSVLTLPSQSGTVTVTVTAQGLSAVSFTAQVIAPAVSIVNSFLPASRAGTSYVRTLSASGGSVGGAFSFAVASGSLPPGLSLAGDGRISGTPTTQGSYPLSIRVSDGLGGEGTQSFTMNVCAPAEPLAVGQSRAFDVSTRGSCGVFLPAGQGVRYRITLVRTGSQPNGSDVQNVSFLVSGNGTAGGTVAAPAAAPAATLRRIATPELERHFRRREANAPAHLRGLEEGLRLGETLAPEALLRTRSSPLRSPAAAAELPQKLRLDPNTPATCGTTSTRVTAIKLAENDWLAIYQDSTQNANTSQRVTPEQGARLIQLVAAYGKPVIDSYFGGVPDIDGNGKVIVFITPAIGQVEGKVWTGDFYRQTECAPSNEAEIIYLDREMARTILDPGLHFGQHILVHEMKHLSSLYRRLLRAGGGTLDPRQAPELNPLWMEEGGAELAAEVAARYAWSQLGGPATHTMVTEPHLRGPNGQGDVRTENLSVLYVLFGAQEALSHQPNSMVALTAGAPPTYLYSTGWLFNRWLGDAYGNAGSGPFGDAPFFRQLNEAATASGVAGIEAITGRSWAQLMEEFAVAAMANGQGVQVQRGFTSYDFVSSVEMWCFAVDPVDLPESGCGTTAGPPGAFPWPVTTDPQGVSQSRGFGDLLLQGGAGPSGLRVHELISNGTGAGAEINVEVTGASRVLVLRLR